MSVEQVRHECFKKALKALDIPFHVHDSKKDGKLCSICVDFLTKFFIGYQRKQCALVDQKFCFVLMDDAVDSKNKESLSGSTFVLIQAERAHTVTRTSDGTIQIASEGDVMMVSSTEIQHVRMMAGGVLMIYSPKVTSVETKVGSLVFCTDEGFVLSKAYSATSICYAPVPHIRDTPVTLHFKNCAASSFRSSVNYTLQDCVFGGAANAAAQSNL
jgi:hypothetical protein